MEAKDEVTYEMRLSSIVISPRATGCFIVLEIAYHERPHPLRFVTGKRLIVPLV